MPRLILTSEVSMPLRDRAIDPKSRSISISRIQDSPQERDLSEPVNCHGFGRIRHFGAPTPSAWPSNPLPVLPAARFFEDRMPRDLRRAQVFQNSVCNWRCWYCYVPFSMLKGDPAKSEFIPVDQLIDWYRSEPNPPAILDLSGGQPDLTPEWIPWTIQALMDRGIQDDVYLWSDDNLSNDFAFAYLSEADWDLMRSYPGYGRVGCFKGFDDSSFSFNTGAEPHNFQTQFDVFRRLLERGIDLYAYITLTCPRPSHPDPAGSVRTMLDRLGEIDERLPLRTVPLEIQVFSPMLRRLRELERSALDYQHEVAEAWMDELEKRFALEELEASGLWHRTQPGSQG